MVKAQTVSVDTETSSIEKQQTVSADKKTDTNIKYYPFGEELANAITHGIGVGLSIAALVILLVYSNSTIQTVSFSLYGSFMILLYLFSTLYHAIPGQKAKRVFRVLDHDSIFLLIAGTYTPFMLVAVRGAWGWSVWGVIIFLAVLGIVLKSIFINNKKFSKITTGVYVLMGWMCMIVMPQIIESMEFGGLMWLVGGGLSYTLGVIFYANKRIPYGHAIWHLFVLGGSICHFFAMLYYVTPIV